VISLGFRRFWISVGHPKGDRLERNPRSLTGRLTVSEGGLEPVERPLDKRVSDILSAKMDPGGPGCTPLLKIGALQERTKVAPDNDPGTKSGPGMSDPGSLVRGVELGYESVDPDCGAWIDKALRWRGPDNAKVRSSGEDEVHT
jgi:hypothetical protein